MRFAHTSLFAAAPLLLLALVACGSDDNNTGTGNGLTGGSGNNGGNTPAPATSQQVDDCKASCDQQKFFDCYDAAAHSLCLQSCGKANTDQADQFIRCVKVETCDDQCSVELTKPPPASNNGGNGSNDCSSACAKLTGCGFLTGEKATSCVSECSSSTTDDAAAIACINANSCADIPSKCVDSSVDGPDDTNAAVAQCQSACSSLITRGCLDGTSGSECSTLCQTATSSSASSFQSCAFATTDCGGAAQCYALFSGKTPSTPPATIAECKQSCEDLAFFSCIGAAEQNSCGSRCELATVNQITSFNSCVDANATDCDQGEVCYTTFVAP